MNRWPEVRDEYFSWLRTFPLQTNIGERGDSPEVFPDGDYGRIEDERAAADSVKRDLAWAATERAIGEQEFFSRLLAWYEQGRWPVGWEGNYPAGHLKVL